MGCAVEKRESRTLTVMSIAESQPGFRHTERRSDFSSNRNVYGSAKIATILQKHRATVVNGTNKSIMCVFGDKESNISHYLSACLAASEIFNISLDQRASYADPQNLGHLIPGVQSGYLQILIVSGVVDIEYERDRRYPIKSVRGPAIEKAKSVHMPFYLRERLSTCVVDNETFSGLSNEEIKAFSESSGYRFIELMIHNESIPFKHFILARSSIGRSSNVRLDDNVSEKIETISIDLPDIDAIPEQVKTGFQFEVDNQNLLSIIEQKKSGFQDSPDQVESYNHIKEKALELFRLCDGSNSLSVVGGYLNRLVISMGGSIQEVSTRSYWSNANRIRRLMEADHRVRNSVDPETPALPERFASLMDDLVDSINVFSAFEPKLRELDDLKEDPSGHLISEAVGSASRQIAHSLSRKIDVVSQETAARIIEVGADAGEITPSERRSSLFFIRTIRNLCFEAIRRVYGRIKDEMSVASKGLKEGAYRALGGAVAVSGIALFVSMYSESIRVIVDHFGGGATLHKIIDLIVRFVA